MPQNEFHLSIYRLPESWAFATQGVFGVGVLRLIEPVFVFGLTQWNSVVETVKGMQAEGNPKTVAPPREEMEAPGPFLTALGIKTWSELYRNCFLWNLQVTNETVSLDLYERRKKKPILSVQHPNLIVALEAIRTYEYTF